MNLSTVKWAQWDKTQSRELLGLFICVCIALCTIFAHNIAQNRPDNFPSYPPITIAPMMSIWGKGGDLSSKQIRLAKRLSKQADDAYCVESWWLTLTRFWATSPAAQVERRTMSQTWTKTWSESHPDKQQTNRLVFSQFPDKPRLFHKHLTVSWSLTSLFSTNIRLYQRRKVRDGKLSTPSKGRLEIY